MTESASAVAALLKPILDAWVHRDGLKAAKAAGSLTLPRWQRSAAGNLVTSSPLNQIEPWVGGCTPTAQAAH